MPQKNRTSDGTKSTPNIAATPANTPFAYITVTSVTLWLLSYELEPPTANLAFADYVSA
jgi:hypothetical protein